MRLFIRSRQAERDYVMRADELIRRFREVPDLEVRRALHAGFKALPCPDAALAYHWAVSEAMRHEIAAREGTESTSAHHLERAAAHWREAERRRRVPD